VLHQQQMSLQVLVDDSRSQNIHVLRYNAYGGDEINWNTCMKDLKPAEDCLCVAAFMYLDTAVS